MVDVKWSSAWRWCVVDSHLFDDLDSPWSSTDGAEERMMCTGLHVTAEHWWGPVGLASVSVGLSSILAGLPSSGLDLVGPVGTVVSVVGSVRLGSLLSTVGMECVGRVQVLC